MAACVPGRDGYLALSCFQTQLKLTVFTALLGDIDGNVRALASDFTDKNIVMYGYLDHKPSADDYESIDIAMTEIMASHSNFIEQNIILVESHELIGKLPSYKGWVFVRKE